jgi:ACS family allantoate permease-like MFS transporter
LPKDAPDYIPGKISILALLVSQIFICLLLRWIHVRLNRKKAEQISAEKQRRGWTDEDLERERQKRSFADLTDKQ